MKIYVASSWRNLLQQGVVHTLRAAGHEVYDFREPRPGAKGFGWHEIDPAWQQWTPETFRARLHHVIATRGFLNDFEAMRWADCCVLVLPCGRSAHLEAGWFAGQDKPVYILALEPCEPELMYRMATSICVNMDELLRLTNPETVSPHQTL